jgi:hypothetical protein
LFFKIAFLLIPFLLFASTADRALYLKQYSNETKTALVIGNANYDGNTLSKLKNPINDARAVRDKLQKKGFDVLYLEDVNMRTIDRTLREFTDKLRNSKVGLFYFAGHGIEVKNQNYLLPLEAKIKDEYDVKYETLSVSEIVDRMKNSGTRLNMVLLDACRSNPFKRGASGLAAMENAQGTLIAFATDSGSTAADNPNESNGLFTKHLLKAFDKPVNQRELFAQVRENVFKESHQEQTPYLNDGTIGTFYFTLPDSNIENKETIGKIKNNDTLELSKEKVFWEVVKEENNQEYYELYLMKYPSGLFVDIAKLKMDKISHKGVSKQPTVIKKDQSANLINKHKLIFLPHDITSENTNRNCNMNVTNILKSITSEIKKNSIDIIYDFCEDSSLKIDTENFWQRESFFSDKKPNLKTIIQNISKLDADYALALGVNGKLRLTAGSYYPEIYRLDFYLIDIKNSKIYENLNVDFIKSSQSVLPAGKTILEEILQVIKKQ